MSKAPRTDQEVINNYMMTFKEHLKEGRITKAGLLPYHIKDEKLFFCMMIPSDPMYGGIEPQISKGTLEPGETLQATAVREAQEELGYIHKSDGDVKKMGIMNGIIWFYVKVDSMNLNKAHFETKEVLWLDASSAFKRIRPWQKPILGKIYHMIRKEEGIK